MAYYLQFDGVDDRLTTPSFTYTEIVMDFKVNSKASFERYWSLPLSAEYFQVASGGVNDQWSSGVSTLYKDGVSQTNSTVVMTTGTRAVARAVFSSAKTNTCYIMHNNSASYAHGDIWDIKFYNGGTLVCHYDMSTQTVNDQSGNGRHGTLVGGTWVNDGGGTAYTASLSDSFSASDTISKSLSVAVVDVVNASETESETSSKQLADNVATSESIAASSGKAINVSDAVAITDSIRKALTLAKSDAVIAGETKSEAAQRYLTDVFTQNDSIIVTGGRAILLADSFTVTDAAARKALSKAVAESLGLVDSIGRSAGVRLYDVTLTTDSYTKQLPNAPIYVQEIPFDVRIKRVLTFDIEIIRSRDFNTRL